jgi:glycosyltransferase involved in cell wall biosynthesis
MLIVCYAGGHGISNALDTFLDAAALMKREDVTFVLVGHGPEKLRLKMKAAAERNVFFLPPVPKQAVPMLLSSADLLYIGWLKSPLYRFGVSPNKLLDYMMSGRPVVHATRMPETISSQKADAEYQSGPKIRKQLPMP